MPSSRERRMVLLSRAEADAIRVAIVYTLDKVALAPEEISALVDVFGRITDAPQIEPVTTTREEPRATA